MATATLRKLWQVAKNGGWAEAFYFWIGSVGTMDALAGCSAQLNLIRPGRPASEALAYAATDAPSYLTVAAGVVAIDIPRTVTASWTPGVYDLQLRVFSSAQDYDLYNLIAPG